MVIQKREKREKSEEEEEEVEENRKEASFLVIAKCLHKLDQYRLHETD